MILRTPRLVLRRARRDDLHDLHAAFSRPEAMRYWSTPEHETLEQTARWIDDMIGATDADDFVVEHQGRAIGKAGAWQLPEVGFLLHPDYWGQGLGREAMTAVIDHLFAAHPLPHLTAEADPRNEASRAPSGAPWFRRDAPRRADDAVARRVVRQHLFRASPRGLVRPRPIALAGS